MKAADITDAAMIQAVRDHQRGPVGAALRDVEEAFPGVPNRVVLAKLRILLRRKLIDGCGCGCRGDFRVTAAGYNSKQCPA